MASRSFLSGVVNRLAVCVLAAATVISAANAKPPIEAFGDVPIIRAADLSPDGTRIAFLNRVDGVDYLVLHDFRTGKSEPLVSIPKVSADGVAFVGDNYVVLLASTNTNNVGMTDRYEDSEAFAYNLKTKKVVQLLLGTQGIYPYQSGLGRISGVDPDGRHVYMPAFMSHQGGGHSLDLLKVSLDTGRGIRTGGKPGTSSTRRWIVGEDGEAIAREDFEERTNTHAVYAYDHGGARKIFSEVTPLIERSIVGYSRETKSLVIIDRAKSNFDGLYEMALADGSVSGPLLQRDDADIEQVIRDKDLRVVGVRYSGMYPSYHMMDPVLDRDLKAAIHALPEASVRLASWTDDWSKLLLYADGGDQPGRYMLFDRPSKTMKEIERSRPQIKPDDVGEVVTIEYKSRDGLTIPGLITWPAGVPANKRKNLPLVVLPHGGPEAYDAVGFDWLAQFMANEGYVVLQPNFRGSAGFGAKFVDAGYHEWGRKMQDDITDGVKAMQTQGWADPSRTCIVGWSYGGYAALAGGAITPDLYKCVVSIAGVSDLRAMLGFEIRRNGPNSQAYTYWTKVIGDPNKDRDAIDAVSPARLADNFKAPVLLIHGTQDTTVPSDQSDKMEHALKSAGKSVEYVKIRGDDHSLSNIESRRTVLASLADFLAKYLK
ncbi:MAG: prolyl oligopeptidase family serine peptidase [Alphaproteobacteria bacterium]|nr:prolyl oligopeptidase family serine peptidase [Alphaproteobacteria bacterium]